MSEYMLRPRFRFVSPQAPASLMSQLNHAVSEAGSSEGLRLTKTQNHFILAFIPKRRSFWSPEMDINIEAGAEGGSTVRVLIGPAAAVWTFYMFLYALALLMMFGGFILSYSQYVLGKALWGFYLLPAAVIMALLIYAAGLWGKKRARAQSQQLQRLVEGALAPLKAV